jgi:FkbM family methyltransferase
MSFIEESVNQLTSSLLNDFKDNWDHIRFGKNEPKVKRGIRSKIQRLINKRGYYHLYLIQDLLAYSKCICRFEYLYNHLRYDEDKKLLLQVLAYRVLGYRKVKLPLNTPIFWDRIRSLEKLVDNADSIETHFLDIVLHKMNLSAINYPIEFYFSAAGVLTDFIIKQYEYNRSPTLIKAEEGDVVIDGGGCWGDTALYFANEVGAKGRVFSFEFIPRNIMIFERNVSLNKNLKDHIHLVERALWKNSSTRMYFKDHGPGSNVSIENFDGADGECYTISIDDMVKQEKLDKVDFIKLDIEGSEMDALIGAKETILKFKPKLAIALYHNVEDFEKIPTLIMGMVPEYEFYFSHCSINIEESILFAKVS